LRDSTPTGLRGDRLSATAATRNQTVFSTIDGHA
jgi:hypothetical protein